VYIHKLKKLPFSLYIHKKDKEKEEAIDDRGSRKWR
jgi:hypothetical protein